MDIKKAMSSFSACNTRGVKRSSNVLAHELAALTRTSGDQRIIADVPECIRPLLIAECTGLS
jgi:hypothetical protein